MVYESNALKGQKNYAFAPIQGVDCMTSNT